MSFEIQMKAMVWANARLFLKYYYYYLLKEFLDLDLRSVDVTDLQVCTVVASTRLLAIAYAVTAMEEILWLVMMGLDSSADEYPDYKGEGEYDCQDFVICTDSDCSVLMMAVIVASDVKLALNCFHCTYCFALFAVHQLLVCVFAHLYNCYAFFATLFEPMLRLELYLNGFEYNVLHYYYYYYYYSTSLWTES
jgi:hypothetical protein